MYLSEEFFEVGNGTLLTTTGLGNAFLATVSDLYSRVVVLAVPSTSEQEAMTNHERVKAEILAGKVGNFQTVVDDDGA